MNQCKGGGLTMNNLLIGIVCILSFLVLSYCFGRAITRGVMDEFNRSLKNSITKFKKQKNEKNEL